MAIILLKDWYQLDITLQANPLACLLKVAAIMASLKSQGLISKWFYLFEPGHEPNTSAIRLRMYSKNKVYLEESLNKLIKDNSLQIDTGLVFSDYQESDETLFNVDVAEAFATIMCEITELTIKKLKKELEYKNYRVMERLQHCMFNIMLTLQPKNEEYFLAQRLLERTRQPFDDNF